MAPVELRYSLNGIQQKTITAEDGIQAILETPAGTAIAKLHPDGNKWFTRIPVVNRLGVLFPGDPKFVRYSTGTDGLHYRIDSMFDYLFPKLRERMKWKGVVRSKTIQTDEGKVKIEAIGYDGPLNSELQAEPPAALP